MDIQLISFVVSGLFVIMGLYGVFFIDNIIKKIISLSIIGNGVNLLLISIGYKSGGFVPIKLPSVSMDVFIGNMAYPLPQALVLTNIVIGASMLAIMLSLSIVFYKKYRTLKSSVILKDD